jgi:hypothetical protein
MKKFLIVILLLVFNFSFSQNWVDDSNFENTIQRNTTFSDDNTKIVVIEFWAKFNDVNSFKNWKQIKNAEYYRVNIEKAPNAKKEYRIRMAPTLIIFKDGIKEEIFKAGLDLECPVDLKELQETINSVKEASQF